MLHLITGAILARQQCFVKTKKGETDRLEQGSASPELIEAISGLVFRHWWASWSPRLFRNIGDQGFGGQDHGSN